MVSASNNKDVGQSGSKGVSLDILHSYNIEGSLVTLHTQESSHASSVSSLGDHNHSTHLELQDRNRFSGRNINLHNIVDLDIRVGESHSAAIVSDSSWDLVGSDVDLDNATKFVIRFFTFDSVKNEASLGVEEETEAISRLFQFDDIHKASRVVVIRSDFAVNLDATLHADLHALLVGQGVLETITQDNCDWQAFAHSVWTSGRLGGPNSPHFAEIPMLGGIEAFQVLLRSASPEVGEEANGVSNIWTNVAHIRACLVKGTEDVQIRHDGKSPFARATSILLRPTPSYSSIMINKYLLYNNN